MKKSNFVTLVLSTIGGLLFSLGMSMCLLPEWNAFRPGVAVSVVGAAIILVAVIYWRRQEGKTFTMPPLRMVGTVALAVVGALVLGVGMCMVMVWNVMLPGILVGVVGIVLLLLLIPPCFGLK